ncbi:hypothetical protein TSUD_33200 [Trifolium subterraneum]|uniref:Reverse transcriptase domain-containing protein n=1 Tax=Trifolium subterraneum TaxID=3900 RepID=A0A2Z6LTC5_TRISU|nr:hypothetical protein TSUD_33200 [Trifolium subterraneum]
MGESIGALLGQVEAAETYEYPGKQVIIKIKVAVNVKNPITSGIHVGNPIYGTCRIDFRYEKLPLVCFKCGLIGHAENICRNQALELETLAPLGPWIRSNQYGRRKMEDKDKRFHSNPSHSKNFGHYSPPIPADLLEKLAAMKVHTTKETAKDTADPHHQPQSTRQNTQNMATNKELQTVQDDRNRKSHKLSYNLDGGSMDYTSDLITQAQSVQAKRQKMEDLSRSRGLALIWNHGNVNMDIINSDFNYIDMILSSPSDTQKWRATGIYGYPQTLNKYLTCRIINDLSCINNNNKWLVFGDFNLVLTDEEKSGGNPLEPNITTSFRNTLCHCDLQDLSFNGSIYTWTNRHQGTQLIQSRLDRFTATSEWITKFPNYTNNHLVRYKSDHSPILLEFAPQNGDIGNNKQQHQKRFEQLWTIDDQHTTIVRTAWQNKNGSLEQKLQHTLNSLHSWGRKTFGIIPKKIKEVQQDLQRLQDQHHTKELTQQALEKEKELDDLLAKEEMWWSQRSRALWLTHGDKNTNFFHQKASQRRRKNKIDTIKDTRDITHTDSDEIEQTFITHFQQLFSTQNTTNIIETVQVVKNKITQDQYDHLNMECTANEVFDAIKEMKSLAAPGPDGFPAKFYHTYWDIVGQEVTKEVLKVLNHGGNPQPYNKTNIWLIPKINNPVYPSDFRPISLCNVTLKIITKTIANRLKPILPTIISPNQSAFVPGRLITDNTLIANEIFHYLSQTTRKTGYVGIKTDMAKAYDRVEWVFLKVTLETMNFPHNLVNTIMKCVSTVSFSILINGQPTKPCLPERGLRQGDPLPPYLFITCADVLSGLITKAQQNQLIHGVKVAPGAPEITHLFIADDSLMFCRENDSETHQIKSIITQYQQASGQLVNYNKSELIFSKKVSQETKLSIQQILPMSSVDHYSKYLGQPTFIGKSKKQVFNFIQDKVWKKLKGWKEKNLSFAGIGTLIKAVAQAIPTYLMSSFLIPKGLCNQMESMMSRFWWGSNVDHRKIHWVSRKKTCKQKKLGGMRFRNLSAFNEALLAKQGWRILAEPQTLLARTLKAKYFPQCKFLQAKPGYRSSYCWQSIQKASWILKRGCLWLIGNGQNTKIWEDRWINPQDGNSIWSPKPANTTLDKDLVSWQGTRDGNYTVRSGYHAQIEWESSSSQQAQTRNNSIDSLNWQKLWKMEVPPKQIHILWRIIHKAIPVKTNLIKKGILCDSLCPNCNKQPETIDHIFFYCDWVRLVWFSSPLTITTSNVPSLSFSDWIFYMLQKATKDSMQILSTITYNIWQARNKKVFNKKDTPVAEVVERVMKILSEYHTHLIDARPQHNPLKPSDDCNDKSWSPPPLTYLKLNVDAHLSGDGRWGFGLVLRREYGRCVRAATRVCDGSKDVAMAETTGLREALQFLDQLQINNVIIKHDAACIVNAFWRKEFPRSGWGRLVQQCSRFCTQKENVSVNWVKRSGNQAAHSLARWAMIEPNRYWTLNFPCCLENHIHKDMEV